MSKTIKLPVIQVPGTAFFPSTVLPLYINHPNLVSMIKELAGKEKPQLIGIQMEESVNFGQNGTICGAGVPIILEELENGHLKIALHGASRVQLMHMTQHIPYPVYQAIELIDINEQSSFLNEEIHQLKELLMKWLHANVRNSGERQIFIETLKSIQHYMDYLCMFLIKDLEVKQNLLATRSLTERINILQLILRQNFENNSIQEDIIEFLEDPLAIDALKDFSQLEKFTKIGH